MSVSVIFVAAGHGHRFGPVAQRPKQFKLLLGKPLLYWPLKTIEKTPAVDYVVLVVATEYLGWARSFIRRENLRKVRLVVEGGVERADSVRHGFEALVPGTKIVLVHDAARAMLTRDVIERVIEGTKRSGVSLAAWPVPDTIKSAEQKVGRAFVQKTIPRKDLWLAQTPQGFRVEIAEKVFRSRLRPTDDVQWAEQAGFPVEIVLGSPKNFKVTLPEDFDVCKKMMDTRR